MAPTNDKLNKFSSRITQPAAQGASQAMLYATGMTEADMNKPQIGIASCWYEGNPCNMHLNDLAAKVHEGVTATDLVGMELVALCDHWKERLRSAGKSLGVATYTDYDKFLEHDMDAVFAIADTVSVIVRGALIASGSVEEIRRDPAVRRAYLGDLH